MAHWLSWKSGIGLNAAMAEALCLGEMSYSARALSRMATPESEGALVDLSRSATAGLHITADTGSCQWDGGRVDYDWASRPLCSSTAKLSSPGHQQCGAL